MLPLHHWIALSSGSYHDAEPGAQEVDNDWLFAACVEATLIVDAQSENILQLNPAASRLAALSAPPLGMALTSIFDVSSATTVQRLLSEARNSGASMAENLNIRAGGRAVRMQLSLVRSQPQDYLLARMESSRTAGLRGPLAAPESAVMEAIDAAPMGFLIAAADLHLEYSNRAFVKMVGAQSQGAVRGSSILRWLRFSEADLSRLSARLSQRQAADVLTVELRPNHGLAKTVEVCAVPVPDGRNTQWGFTVRPLPRLN